MCVANFNGCFFQTFISSLGIFGALGYEKKVPSIWICLLDSLGKSKQKHVLTPKWWCFMVDFPWDRIRYKKITPTKNKMQVLQQNACPKYPDPSKVPILRTYTPLLYRFIHPSIGGSLRGSLGWNVVFFGHFQSRGPIGSHRPMAHLSRPSSLLPLPGSSADLHPNDRPSTRSLNTRSLV